MKFAYMIMAHHRFDVLKLLLEDLDSFDNDIYLHIDRKARDVPIEELARCVTKSKLVFIKRMAIYWGDSSQIRCVLRLLQEAVQSQTRYDYYHFLVGVEFPIKTQSYIADFFQRNSGKEFIGFDSKEDYSDRVRYYYFWRKYIRFQSNPLHHLLLRFGERLLCVQKRVGIDRRAYDSDYYKKGYANWSITHDLAEYFLKMKKDILHMSRWTFCADEVVFHTLVYHSEFYNRIYDKQDEYESCMRTTTWTDPHNQYHLDDVTLLINSNKLFARKFDDADAVTTIQEIKKFRR